MRRARVHAAALAPRGLRDGRVEASAHATPSIVVAGEDNAATELVEDGVNGVVVASADDPEAIADAIVRVHEAGLGAAREHRRVVRRERRASCRWSPRWRRCWRATRTESPGW